MATAVKSMKRLVAVLCVLTVMSLVAFLQYTRQDTAASIKLQQDIIRIYPTATSDEKPIEMSSAADINGGNSRASFPEMGGPGNDSEISLENGTCAIMFDFLNASLITDSEHCKLPKMDPFNPDLMSLLKPVKSINCKGRLYTEYENNVLTLLDDVNEGLSN